MSLRIELVTKITLAVSGGKLLKICFAEPGSHYLVELLATNGSAEGLVSMPLPPPRLEPLISGEFKVFFEICSLG